LFPIILGVNLIAETLAMKNFQSKGILLSLFLLLMPGITFGQDILYKKDSTSVKVNIISFNGKTVKYQIPGDTSGYFHFLSKSVLDSLKYSDGKSINLTYGSNIQELPPKRTDRNYFSTELVNLFTGKPNLDYERISENGKTGFVTGLLINFNTYDDIYWYGYRDGWWQFYNFSPHYFFVRTGINFYPFSQSLVRTGFTRFSTGFSLLLGSYRKINWDTYYDNGYKTKAILAGSLMWTTREKIFLSDHFLITGGLEISVIPFFTFFCPQIGLSIGF
jgi:hypothetical protein